MPASPGLPETLVEGNTGHVDHTNTVHNFINNTFRAVMGTAVTTDYTLTQANSGEIIPVDSTSTVTITCPVLLAGTSIELWRRGTGAVTVAASGTSFYGPVDTTPAPRVQGSVISLLWVETSGILIGGDVT